MNTDVLQFIHCELYLCMNIPILLVIWIIVVPLKALDAMLFTMCCFNTFNVQIYEHIYTYICRRNMHTDRFVWRNVVSNGEKHIPMIVNCRFD